MKNTEERLGRRVYSNSKAKDFAQGKTKRLFREYLGKMGKPFLSVDRLGVLSMEALVLIAKAAEASRGGASFTGWASVTREDAGRSGRSVLETPTDENRAHADIELPAKAVNNEEERERHAKELADASTWCPAPANVDCKVH